MHTVTLIANSLKPSEREPLPCDSGQGVCAVTGLEGQCVPRKHLFGKSFTNGDMMRAPHSDMVHVDTWFAMKHRPTRTSSWVCDTHRFRPLKRVDVRPLVLDGVPAAGPWAGFVTTSYKKHGSLRAPINTGGCGVWAWDDVLVDCRDGDTVNAWYSRIREALVLGFGRTILETLDCPPHIMAKVGLQAWMEYHDWAATKVNSRLYQFLCYLLPSKEELKNEARTQNDVLAPREGQAVPAQAGLFDTTD